MEISVSKTKSVVMEKVDQNEQECGAMEDSLTATVESKSKTKSNFFLKSEENNLHSDIPLHRCDICRQAAFPSTEALIAHRYIHTLGTSFTCIICQDTFRVKHHMYTHMLNTHSNPTSTTLSKHTPNQSRKKRVRTCDMFYECDICAKRYKQQWKLTRHELSHTGEKPFECDICHKRFTRKGRLTRHECVHSREKSFECDICHKRYKQKRKLTRHKRCHSGGRTDWTEHERY